MACEYSATISVQKFPEMRPHDFSTAPVQASISLRVERIVDLVYSFQNLAARLAEDAGITDVPLPPRSQRDTLAEMVMHELVGAVADIGLVDSILPVDETEVVLKATVRGGLSDALGRFIHEAAAYGVLAWILGGIHAPLSEKYRRLRELRVATAKGVVCRERVAIAARYV